jgi:hypothetical protein
MALLCEGRIVAEGPPDAVLGAPEAARAFGVTITGHVVSGLPQPVYSFRDLGS